MRKRRVGVALGLAAVCIGAAAPKRPAVIPGRVPLDWRGPDGNTVLIDAPKGLIVVDTGRSPQHAQAILAEAARRGRPIAAIMNTHWHLDHTTGNADLRERFPQAPVYATTAIEGALADFLQRGRANGDKRLADPNLPEPQKAQILRGRDRIDHPDKLRPTQPIIKSGRYRIAGRILDVRVAPFAATEADLWIYDAQSRTAIVGDLVVDIVPFMDTACADGWARALDAVAATPFQTLIPGHGEPMTQPQFLRWKGAFTNLIECGRSDRPIATCSDQWVRDAEPFIAQSHQSYAKDAAGYYIQTRLRSSPEEQQRYCRPQGEKS